jgi:hypothetical protein
VTAAVVLTVLGAFLAAWVWRRIIQSSPVQFLWHFCTGLEMGKPREPREERRWSRGRHAQVRAGTVAVLFGLLYGLIVAYTVTVWALAAAVTACTAWGGRWLWRRICGWHHHRHYVQPLTWSLTDAITAPDRVEIVRAGAEVKSVTAAWAPDTEIGPKDQELALQAVATRLALEGAVPKWNLRGRNRIAVFTPCPSPPPTRVTLRDIRPAIEGSGPHELIVGIGQSNTAVAINLDNDACHLALSIGPGGGKTLAARALAIQVLYKGGLVVVLNAKKTGYNWTRGLPNVAHAKTIDEIAEAILWLNTERKRREDVVEAAGDIEDEVPDDVHVGPRILTVFEEQNLTVPKLRKEREDAFEALGDMNFAGRAALENMLAIAQRYSAKAAGGGDVRAAVNARLLGRYDKKAWNMLADSFPMPAPNNAPGRVQVVTDEVHEAQMPKVGGQEAHDYALSGIVARCPVEMPCRCAIGVPVLAGALQNTGPEQGFPLGQPLTLPPYEPDVITLREACQAGYFGRRSLETVRSASKRDPAFPQPVSRDGAAGFTYDDDELREYAARKAGRR